MAAKPIGSEIYAMKKNKLLTLIGAALVGVGPPAWAGPHGGGFGGGGHFGGFAGGGFRAAPTFHGGGARVSGKSFGGPNGAARFYYGGTRMSTVRPHGFTAATSRSISPNAGRVAAANRQPNRVGSIAGQNRVSDPRSSTAANRQSFIKNHAFARHDANWHRDWDRRHAHFHHGHAFVFIDGFWWGLDPGFYPFGYYAYGYYPYDYYGYRSDYYEDSPYDYDDQSAYVDADQYGNSATVSAVQSELARLRYYRGAIDGVVGDETEAALARYQEDHDLSVTGTLTAATLQSLGLARTAS
jgi:hypothetical protein